MKVVRNKNVWSLYKITNRINNKYYIGVHKECKYPKMDKYMSSGKVVHQAIKKYGVENFHRKVLVYGSGEYCYSLEGKIVDEKFVNCINTYNICGGGIGRSYTSEETIRKISESNKIRWTEAMKKENSESKKGKPRSLETCKKISESQKGKLISLETRKKMSKAKKGKLLSLETRKKMSKAMKGKPKSLKHCKKMSEVRMGKTASLSTRKKMSEAWTESMKKEHSEKLKKYYREKREKREQRKREK